MFPTNDRFLDSIPSSAMGFLYGGLSYVVYELDISVFQFYLLCSILCCLRRRSLHSFDHKSGETL